MGARPHLSFCACKTAWLAPELLFSMGPSPHLWFLNAKQRLLDQNNKSLWVPDLTCRFVHPKWRDYHHNYLSLWVPALICAFWMQNSVFWSRITSLYGSQTSPVVLCTQNSVISTELLVSMGPRPHLWFLNAKQLLLVPNYKSLWVPDITCPFVHEKQRDKHNSLYGSQTTPVILCMQNSVPSFTITSLYGSQPLSVVFGCKTAPFGPEQQVSMGPTYHLSLCACKTAWLAQEILFSMGPSPHLWFLHAKQRLLDQNFKYLWVPHLTCRFAHAKLRD